MGRDPSFADNRAAGPWVVDLDGTLIKTDLLVESALLLLKHNPLYLFLLPLWLARGKSVLKQEIARRVDVDPARLPYRDDVIAFLQQERDQGRVLILATASHQKYADAVAAHLGLFERALGTSETHNLKGSGKLSTLQQELDGPFGYLGDSTADRPLFEQAAASVLVGRLSQNPERHFKGVAFARTFPEKKRGVRPLIKALRPHQWAKNVLIFVPLVLAHRIFDVPALVEAGLAFASFSLCASSVYVVNDLLDLPSDRVHHRKKTRPFASGDLPVLTGMWLAPALLGAAFVLAALALSVEFLLVLAAYYVVTTLYSVVLKRIVLIDVLVLAGLYTLRIGAGAAATHTPISHWLFTFSLFFFLNLAFVKRFIELDTLQKRGDASAEGRGYRVADHGRVSQLGTAAGYASILVLALYINSPSVTRLYPSPTLLWGLLPPFLYWVNRVWIIAGRGEMHDDPIVFALKDKVSYAVVASLAAVLLAAKLWTV